MFGLLFYIGMLCGLAAVVFGALAARRAALVVSVAAFATAAAFLPDAVPQPAVIGTVVAAAAGAALWAPRFALVAAACGGLVAAVLADVLAAQGLPVLVARAVALAPLLAAAALAARRPDFAPIDLREEALAVVAVLALAAAAAPRIIDGFNSAVALKAVPLAEQASPAGLWALAVAACFVVLGGLYALRKRP